MQDTRALLRNCPLFDAVALRSVSSVPGLVYVKEGNLIRISPGHFHNQRHYILPSFVFEAKTLTCIFGLAHLYLCLFSLSLAGVGFTTPERYGSGDPFPFQPSQGVGLCESFVL